MNDLFKRQTNTIECPTDKKKVSLPNGVASLPKNYAILNSIAAPIPNFDLTVDRKCQICAESHHAASLCLVCKEFMCAAMASAHHTMKATREHPIVTFEELAKDPSLLLSVPPTCPDHPDQEFRFFDKDCCRPICRDCAITHRAHNCVGLADAVAEGRAELSKMGASAVKRVKELAAAEAECSSVRAQLEGRYAAEARKVQTAFQATRDAVAAREAAVLQELAAAFRLKDSALGGQVSHRVERAVRPIYFLFLSFKEHSLMSASESFVV
jgi:hypothetical protein